MFRCSVCGVTSTSEKNHQQHVRGRGHMRNLDRLRLAQRSVFVRGFAGETSDHDLQALLERRVGKVASVWVSDKAQYAMVEFSDPKDALKALKLSGLQMEGKKLVIKPRKIQPLKKEKKASDSSEASSSSTLEKLSDCGVNISEERMKQIPEVEGQVQYLSQQNKMTDADIEKRLKIAFQMLKVFRPLHPRCLVIPFGSVISGPATPLSDCDFALIRNPTPHLAHVLTGQRYFSSRLMSVVSRLEVEYGVLMTPEVEDGTPPSVATPSQSPSVTTPSRFQHIEETKALLAEVGKLIETLNVTKVHRIPHARCPILKFHHIPTDLSCDLCVDQYLGPLNSRLLRYYCEFDARIPVIITFVKLWRQMMSISPVRLNSYALSLMVIYSVQHCSPPVLPCLHDPVGWPLNMDAFQTLSQQQYSDRENPLSDSPWHCGFTSPHSLLPSTNKHSTASLLLHFFKFYSQKFDFGQQAVSIRTSGSAGLTRHQAVSQCVEVGVMPQAKSDFHQPPMVVQDPFDLSHNVTRAVRPVNFKTLMACMRQTSATLQEMLDREAASHGDPERSLLQLFDSCPETQDMKTPPSRREGSTNIHLTCRRVAGLLCRPGGKYETLAGKKEELELELGRAVLSEQCWERVGLAVLGELLDILTSKYKFTCEEESSESMDLQFESVKAAAVAMEQVPIGVREGGGASEEEGVAGVARKRKRTDEDFPEDADGGLRKHERSEDMPTDTPTGLLQSLLPLLPQPGGSATCYVCSVWENTWSSSRRKRREAVRASANMDTEASTSSTPPLNSESTPLRSEGQAPPPVSDSTPLQVEGLADTLPSPWSDNDSMMYPPSSLVLRLRVMLAPPTSWVTDHACKVLVEREEGPQQEFLNFLSRLRMELYHVPSPRVT